MTTNEQPLDNSQHDAKLPVSSSAVCSVCQSKPAQEPHTCPFAEEIHGDSESLCDCCDDCMHQCSMDI